MVTLRDILAPMRIPFLILTPASVFMGIGTAVWTSGSVSILFVALAFIGAVSAHISVNSLNEYFDFKSGLDFHTKRTPFSGGSGILTENPEMARYALAVGSASFALTSVVGIYFLIVRGWLLLPLGLIGLFVVSSYTIWLTRNPLLCLIAPGLGFGTFMVMGTDFVLTGSYSLTAFITSLVPFFLVSNLLLLNQFPDVEADHNAGRRHLPILIGVRKSCLIYGIFLLLTYVSIIVGIYLHYLPQFSLIGLCTIGIAVPTFLGVYRYSENIQKLMPYMGLNVILVIATLVLVASGLLIG